MFRHFFYCCKHAIWLWKLRKVTTRERGTVSEQRLIVTLLRLGYPPEAIFHDLYVGKTDGIYAQIDVVLLTVYGIVVFEVKEYSGWLFGNGQQTHWTQLIGDRYNKHRFYSPILQNRHHIEALQAKLGASADVPYFSVVVFDGSCILKEVNDVQDDVLLCYLAEVPAIMRQLESDCSPVEYKDLEETERLLRLYVHSGANCLIREEHAAYVRRIKEGWRN